MPNVHHSQQVCRFSFWFSFWKTGVVKLILITTPVESAKSAGLYTLCRKREKWKKLAWKSNNLSAKCQPFSAGLYTLCRKREKRKKLAWKSNNLSANCLPFSAGMLCTMLVFFLEKKKLTIATTWVDMSTILSRLIFLSTTLLIEF